LDVFRAEWFVRNKKSRPVLLIENRKIYEYLSKFVTDDMMADDTVDPTKILKDFYWDFLSYIDEYKDIITGRLANPLWGTWLPLGAYIYETAFNVGKKSDSSEINKINIERLRQLKKRTDEFQERIDSLKWCFPQNHQIGYFTHLSLSKLLKDNHSYFKFLHDNVEEIVKLSNFYRNSYHCQRIWQEGLCGSQYFDAKQLIGLHKLCIDVLKKKLEEEGL
jgi:hypothetical protein